MNITQSYVSLFFFLTWFLSARFKGFSLRTQTLVISWFRLFSVFWRYIHLLKFSITCVFVFGFFVFFFFPRGQAWVFDFRNQALARLLSKKQPFMNLKNSAASAPEDMPGRGRCPHPPPKLCSPERFLVDSGQPGTRARSVFTPDLLVRKGKKTKKISLRNHLAI